MTAKQHDADRDRALAMQLARAAGNVIAPYFRARGQVENKQEASGGYDPVTEADRAAEQTIRSLLALHRPEDGIIGEEFPPKPTQSGRNWIIDPIDGTRSFITGIPLWGVLIALNQGGEPVLGLGYQPYLDEMFMGDAWGARLNERDIATRPTQHLAEARLATTDLHLFTPEERPVFERIAQAAQLCRFGYDWYAYAMLAAGHIDLVIESGLKAHDVQALIPIIRAAGGVVTDWRGGDPQHGGQIVAAATAALHEDVLKRLNSAAAP